jgi:hypothetical protein
VGYAQLSDFANILVQLFPCGIELIFSVYSVMVATFHCFCAICGCTLRPAEVGSSSESALKRRRARVARRVDWRQRGLGYYYETEDEEEETARESGLPDDVRPSEDDDACRIEGDGSLEDPDNDDTHDAGDGASVHSYDTEFEDNSYDPELTSEESLSWLGYIRCLSSDPAVLGPDRCAKSRG